MTHTRDPVSVLFDSAARRLLDRAYAHPHTWVQVWLPDPGIRQRTRMLEHGIGDLLAPDPLPKGGGLDARTRWGRGFVRAVYYQHRNYSPRSAGGSWSKRTSPRNTGGLRVEIGRHVPGSPQFDPTHPERGGLPPRRRVRVQLAAGGRAKAAAVDRLAARDKWIVDERPGPRYGGGGRFRDWA